jgi:hypothetical protein
MFYDWNLLNCIFNIITKILIFNYSVHVHKTSISENNLSY